MQIAVCISIFIITANLRGRLAKAAAAAAACNWQMLTTLKMSRYKSHRHTVRRFLLSIYWVVSSPRNKQRAHLQAKLDVIIFRKDIRSNSCGYYQASWINCYNYMATWHLDNFYRIDELLEQAFTLRLKRAQFLLLHNSFCFYYLAAFVQTFFTENFAARKLSNKHARKYFFGQNLPRRSSMEPWISGNAGICSAKYQFAPSAPGPFNLYK